MTPISRVRLGQKSTYEYRYWLLVDDEKVIAADLNALGARYSAERGLLTNTR